MTDATQLALAVPIIAVVALALLLIIACQLAADEDRSTYPPRHGARPAPVAALPDAEPDEVSDARLTLLLAHVHASLFAAAWRAPRALGAG